MIGGYTSSQSDCVRVGRLLSQARLNGRHPLLDIGSERDHTAEVAQCPYRRADNRFATSQIFMELEWIDAVRISGEPIGHDAHIEMLLIGRQLIGASVAHEVYVGQLGN